MTRRKTGHEDEQTVAHCIMEFRLFAMPDVRIEHEELVK